MVELVPVSRNRFKVALCFWTKSAIACERARTAAGLHRAAVAPAASSVVPGHAHARGKLRAAHILHVVV